MSEERVRFGEEMERAFPLIDRRVLGNTEGAPTYDWTGYDRCPTCHVERGEFHEVGCTLEKCPRCGWQAIACWCADQMEQMESWYVWRKEGPLTHIERPHEDES